MYHPDMSRNPKSAEMFRIITYAYEKLIGEAPEEPPPQPPPPPPAAKREEVHKPPPPERPKTSVEQILEQLGKGSAMYYCSKENQVVVAPAGIVICKACGSPKKGHVNVIEKVFPRGEATTPYCCTKTSTLIIGDKKTLHYCELCGERCDDTHVMTSTRREGTLLFQLPPQIPPPRVPEQRPQPPPPPTSMDVATTIDQTTKQVEDWANRFGDRLLEIIGTNVVCPYCGSRQILKKRCERFCIKCGSRLRR